MRVLIVDDLEANRMLLSYLVEKQGNVAITCSNAEDALDAYQTHGADLIFMDVQMPGMDGEELAKRIRALDSFRTTPLIILSSVDQSMDVATRTEIGFCELLLKPVRSEGLQRAIARSLQLKEMVSLSPVSTGLDREYGRRLNVLVAEDNKTNQLVFGKMLKSLEIELTFANNGEEAVALYEEIKPDIVFMDISMPKKDGKAATSDIRALEKSLEHRTPIIAMTAHAMSGDQDAILSAGLDHYLTKPLKKALVIEQITKLDIKGVRPVLTN